MKKLLLTTLLASSLTHAADIQNIGDWSQAEPSLIIGFASRHIDSDDHKYLNESNPAIGVEAWDIQAIYVKHNSWNHESLYLTYAPDWKINRYITLTAQAGIATGYKCNLSMISDEIDYHNTSCTKSGVTPLAAATVSIRPFKNNFAVDLSINPSVAMFSVSYYL